MFLHRNYLPSIGILLAVTDIGVRLYQNNRTIVTVATVLILLGFSICTRSLVYQWSGDPRMIIIEVINNPKSIRANFRAGQLYNGIAMTSVSGTERLKYRTEASKYFRNIRKINPRDITGELSILESYLRFREPPPKILLDNLVQAISTAKIKSAATNVFTSIIQCLIKEGCSLQASEFQRLMDGLLSNPSISGRQRGDLLGNYAAYVLEYENDINKAISIVLQAIDDEPSLLELHTLLIFYYGKSGNTEDIKRALDTLDRKDRFGQYGKYIRQAREEVNASVDSPHTP
jgi:tetratricopeptide (TPR) repeat protein